MAIGVRVPTQLRIELGRRHRPTGFRRVGLQWAIVPTCGPGPVVAPACAIVLADGLREFRKGCAVLGGAIGRLVEATEGLVRTPGKENSIIRGCGEENWHLFRRRFEVLWHPCAAGNSWNTRWWPKGATNAWVHRKRELHRASRQLGSVDDGCSGAHGMADKHHVVKVQLLEEGRTAVSICVLGIVDAFSCEAASWIQHAKSRVLRCAIDVWEDDYEAMRHIAPDGVCVHGPLSCGAVAED